MTYNIEHTVIDGEPLKHVRFLHEKRIISFSFPESVADTEVLSRVEAKLMARVIGDQDE